MLLGSTLDLTCKHDLTAVLWVELEGKQRTSNVLTLWKAARFSLLTCESQLDVVLRLESSPK